MITVESVIGLGAHTPVQRVAIAQREVRVILDDAVKVAVIGTHDRSVAKVYPRSSDRFRL